MANLAEYLSMTPRAWVLDLPAGGLNANDRDGHWGRRHRNTTQMRKDAATMARVVKLPQLQRARIVAVYCPPDNRRHDAANLAPVAKGYVDGLVAAGYLPDDDSWHVIGPDIRTGGFRSPFGRLVLRIAELPPLAVINCVSAVAAAAVAEHAWQSIPTELDPQHRAHAKGRRVTVMYTDETWFTTLAAWAHTHGHTQDLPHPRT